MAKPKDRSNSLPDETAKMAPDEAADQTLAMPAEGTVTSADGLPPLFGKYRIEKKLGEGAMGAVYLAFDGHLERNVALKIPFFGNDRDQEIVDRFYREARAMATLRHPNLCPVFEAGEVDGTHYLTMAFIDGRPLSEFLKRKKSMPPRSVAAVMRKLATAMYEAHEKGVVHRDLKPANIMIDSRNEPIIMDFGLARREEPGDSELTHAGQVLGTPSYMSPEQVEGDQSQIGPASDIYSLGVIMYQMLTGRTPHQGSAAAVLGKVLTETPKRPSQLQRGVDADIEAICLKAMAKQAGSRFSTAEEMADALRLYLKGHPGEIHDYEDVTDAPTLHASAGGSTTGVELQALTRELFDQLNAEEDRRAGARKRRNVAIAFLFLILLGAAAVAGWKLTDRGQIIVQSYDPHARVTVRRDGQPVDEFEVMQRPQSTSYYSGDFSVSLAGDEPAGAKVRNGQFVLRRGEMVIVEIIPAPYRDAAMYAIEHRGLVFVVGENQVAATLAQLPAGEFNIRRLDLVSSTDQQIKELVDRMTEMPKAPDVHLTGDSPQVTDQGLAEFKRVPTIEGVGVSSAAVTDSGVRELANLPNIKSLELNDLAVGDEAIATIAENARSLEKLVATDIPVTDAALQQLKQLTQLESLEIDSPAVTDAGLQHLAEFASLKSLTVRDNPNITAAGIEAISRIENLEKLGLSGSAIQDEHLATLAGMKSLRELDVSNTEVSDVGVVALKDSQLAALDVSNTKVSSHGTAFIQSVLLDSVVESRFSPNGKPVGTAIAAAEAVAAKQRQQSVADQLGVPVEFTNSLGMQFRLIPHGEFVMGAPAGEIAVLMASANQDTPDFSRGGSQHKVTLRRPFYIGMHEVTQDQYLAVMGINPSLPPRHPRFPVGMVPWFSAVDFCNRLSEAEGLRPCYRHQGESVSLLPDGNGYRLPTEAEWEYACRGGTTTAWSFADSASELREYAWFNANSDKRPHEVGKKKPNAYGLFDMYGNNWEWCEDASSAEPYPPGDVTDPRNMADARMHMTRGGHHLYAPSSVRSAHRLQQLTHMTYNHGGFRVVLAGKAPNYEPSLVGGLIPAPKKHPQLAAWQLFTKEPRGGIGTVKWSPDARRIAAYVPTESACRIYDAASFKLTHIVPDCRDASDIAWNSDGSLLAVAKPFGVELWNAADGRWIGKINQPIRRGLAFSPDDQWLTGFRGNTVYLTRADGSETRWLDHPRPVTTVGWSPDGKWLATTDGAQLRLWQADGTPGPVIDGVRGSADWHADSTKLAAGHGVTVKVWSVDGTELQVSGNHDGAVERVRWMASGQGLVSATRSSLWQWNGTGHPTRIASSAGVVESLLQVDANSLVASRKNSIQVLRFQNDQFVESLSLGQGGMQVIIDSNLSAGQFVSGSTMHYDAQFGTNIGPGINGRLQVHNADGSVAATLSGEQARPQCIAWSPRTSEFATGHRDGTVRVWDVNGQPIRLLHGLASAVTSVAWHPNGLHLAAVDAQSGLVMWDGTNRPLLTRTGQPNITTPAYATAVAFFAGGDRLARGGIAGVELIDWQDPAAQPVRILEGAGHWVRPLKWSPNGLVLATGCSQQGPDIRLWNSSGRELLKLKPQGVSTFLDWHPSGAALLVGGWSYTSRPSPLELISADGRTTKELIPAGPLFHAAAWIPNGRAFFTAGEDGVLLWTAQGQPGPKLEHADKLPDMTGLAMSPDGRAVATCGTYGIAIWDTRTAKLKRLVVPLPDMQFAAFDSSGNLAMKSGMADDQLVVVARNDEGKSRLATFSQFRGVRAQPRGAVKRAGRTITPTDGWVDLVPKLEPIRHATGGWKKTADGLLAQGTNHNTISVPYRVGGNYELRVQVTQLHNSNATFWFDVVLPSGGKYAELIVGRGGIHELLRSGRIVAGHSFIGGQVHEFTIRFEGGTAPRVTLTETGADPVAWQVQPESLGHDISSGKLENTIGLHVVTRADRLFRKVELRMLSGQADWIAPVRPPLAKAPFDGKQARAHQQAWSEYAAVPVDFKNSLDMAFRLVPAGEFMMGTPQDQIEAMVAASPDKATPIRAEGPQHAVRITRPFYLGTHEVTQQQYRQVMGASPARFSATGAGKNEVAGMDTSDFPVETVSFVNMADFCNKLSESEGRRACYARDGDNVTLLATGNGYRLPTEAEWEYACRAGTTTRYFFGDDTSRVGRFAWVDSTSGNRTHRVGELLPNAFGLHDMTGNVWEWCHDWYSTDYFQQFAAAPAVDPTGPATGDQRMLRGGLWNAPEDHYYSSARRNFVGPTWTRFHGARVLLTIAPPESAAE